MPQEELLTSAQIAVIFGVSSETVRQWAEAGKLNGFRTPGGHWRFRRSEIDAMLAPQDGAA